MQLRYPTVNINRKYYAHARIDLVAGYTAAIGLPVYEQAPSSISGMDFPRAPSESA